MAVNNSEFNAKVSPFSLVNEIDLSADKTICIYVHMLTTGQCCSRDGYSTTSYSITIGDQYDVIPHTRGKAGDVIAAP